jgi:hypothetical protein
VANLWIHNVTNKEGIHKDSLNGDDHGSLKESWLFEVEEDNQMEPLIVGLFK